MEREIVYSEVRIASVNNLPTNSRRLGAWQRYIVAHAYPPKLILDSIGLMWSLHFVWERMWAPAAIAALIFSSVGTFLAREIDRRHSPKPGRVNFLSNSLAPVT